MAAKMISSMVIGLLFTAVHAETLTGRVVAVADGDTVTVLDSINVQHKVRVAGIDAPENKGHLATDPRTTWPN